ncbi:hypothetical protein ABD72_05565 [Brevibacillus laterosporus]|nr:hypothetical protein [Brevibacillus laterosporus]TPH10691.1 hypothetical protein EGH09_19860 [Brevibacillus laterosporus]
MVWPAENPLEWLVTLVISFCVANRSLWERQVETIEVTGPAHILINRDREYIDLSDGPVIEKKE